MRVVRATIGILEVRGRRFKTMIRFRQIEAFRSLIMTGTSVGAAVRCTSLSPPSAV
ncbi:MAG: hypothetical protein CBARDMAM_4280 [uncultured Caballeronia sp.]|nr:MAG: hypothetical protein CBARDMAM_4280 [uncultured Caballeronia sp.]